MAVGRRVSAILLLGIILGVSQTHAQTGPRQQLWDTKLGTPIASLVRNDFGDIACGSNGGPPSRVLSTFQDYKLCPTEQSTGLHEIYFTYDDVDKYIALAHQNPEIAARVDANQILEQPVIFSYLVDDAGRLQGYRIVTDPRGTSARTRLNAARLADIFKSRYGDDGWNCVETPPGEGESPIDGIFTNESCTKSIEGSHVTVASHFFRKAGQSGFDPHTAAPTIGAFESTARLEVYVKGP